MKKIVTYLCAVMIALGLTASPLSAKSENSSTLFLSNETNSIYEEIPVSENMKELGVEHAYLLKDSSLLGIGDVTKIGVKVPAKSVVFLGNGEWTTYGKFSLRYAPASLKLQYGLSTRKDTNPSGKRWFRIASNGMSSATIYPTGDYYCYPYVSNFNSQTIITDITYGLYYALLA